MIKLRERHLNNLNKTLVAATSLQWNYCKKVGNKEIVIKNKNKKQVKGKAWEGEQWYKDILVREVFLVKENL